MGLSMQVHDDVVKFIRLTVGLAIVQGNRQSRYLRSIIIRCLTGLPGTTVEQLGKQCVVHIYLAGCRNSRCE